MMSHLNSVLLEGELINDPSPYVNGYTDFTIQSRRYVKTPPNNVSEELHTFRVDVFGRLGEVCAEKLKNGRGVRVVGRLSNAGGSVHIVAEHVEFKPVKREEPTDENK